LYKVRQEKIVVDIALHGEHVIYLSHQVKIVTFILAYRFPPILRGEETENRE
jgi:hypothetical protein